MLSSNHHMTIKITLNPHVGVKTSIRNVKMDVITWRFHGY